MNLGVVAGNQLVFAITVNLAEETKVFEVGSLGLSAGGRPPNSNRQARAACGEHRRIKRQRRPAID
jgi:hypothetical protein